MSRFTKIVPAILLFFCIGVASCAIIGDLRPLELKLGPVTVLDAGDPASAPSLVHDSLRVRPLLVVNFSADRDLSKVTNDNGYHIVNDASFCHDGEFDASQRLLSDPYVFDKSGEVDARIAFREATSPRSYTIYVATKSILVGNGSEYDLKRNPRDVCIKLRGRNMLGGGFASNVLLVPKAIIASAFSQ